jgi:hypothetical protein
MLYIAKKQVLDDYIYILYLAIILYLYYRDPQINTKQSSVTRYYPQNRAYSHNNNHIIKYSLINLYTIYVGGSFAFFVYIRYCISNIYEFFPHIIMLKDAKIYQANL